MKSKYVTEIIVDVILILFIVFFVNASFLYPTQARFTPLIVGLPTLFLIIVQFISHLTMFIKEKKVMEKETDNKKSKLLLIFAWLFLTFLLIYLFGITIAILSSLFWLEKYFFKEPWLRSFIIASLALGVPYFIFRIIFSITLWEGVIVRMFE